MLYSVSEYAYLLKALSDETRLRILGMLSGDEICACEILKQLNITQPTLSYHMKLLCSCGLVEGRKDGSWMRYTIQQQRLDELQTFLQQFPGSGSKSKVQCTAAVPTDRS